MFIEPPKKSNKSFLLVLLLLAVGTVCFVLFIGDLSLFSSGPSSFIIQNFWGKTHYSSPGKSWVTPDRAKQLHLGDRLRTGPDGGLDIRFKGTRVRMKENTEIRIQAPKNSNDRIQLKKGTLLVSSATPLQINVPGRFENADFFSKMIVTASKGIFSMGTESPKGLPWIHVSVLTGKVAARTGTGKSIIIKELQKAEPESPKTLKIKELSEAEWEGMSEAYELVSKSAADEALQMDLAKKAGNFFESVFDHGTFYNPKSGFCERDFIQDPDTGQIHMEVRYDVFPREALVGVYMKTRDFDLSKYKNLKFNMRRVFETNYPEKFLLEVKLRGQVIRKYVAKMIRQEWSPSDFPLNFTRKTMVDEITLTFAHDEVGASKKGSVQLKDFTVEPKTAEELEEEAIKTAAPRLTSPISTKTVDAAASATQKTAPKAPPPAPEPPPTGMTEFRKASETPRSAPV